MKPTFHISQTSSLIDTSLSIHISNLSPNEMVKIRAEMRDNVGMDWNSFADFQANHEGKIDLAKAQPLLGTYDVADVMGLFWSMSPVPNVQAKKGTPLEPLKTKLSLWRGEELIVSTSIIREVVSAEVQKVSVYEDGLVGTFFFHPNGKELPTILVLGGSEGGLRVSNAALLASYGFNTLALAYFGKENLPKQLVRIPLEYIEKAINWLRNHPNVDAQKMGVFGTSKGGELALLLASKSPAIKAVVGYVPSGIVYPGLGQSPVESSWQYKGESIPFAYREVPSKVTADVDESIEQNRPIAWRETYLHWADGEEHAEIAVEHIHGPILLISGGDDQLWPADILSEKIMDRLQKCGHPFANQHIHYPKAGHAFVVPGLPTTQSVTSPYGAGSLLLGGTPRDNAYAQFDAWRKVVDFLKEHL